MLFCWATRMATASLLYLAHATRSTLDSVSIIVYRGSSPGAGSVTPAVVYLMNTSPQILVEPLSGMFADPVEIRVVGVEPGNLLALEATLTDRLGARYRGLGTFTADANGVVDVTRQAPRSGTYACVDKMGLFWSVEQTASAAGTEMLHELPESTSVTLVARIGDEEVARTELERRYVASDTRIINVREDGLVGRLYLPPGDALPGILVLTGSSGGLALQPAAELAARGYAAFALAYFGIEGRPEDLSETPLEYLEAGLGWLGGRAEVDSGTLGVMGTSKGGELSLLLGATYPKVRAVVAYVPSTLVYAWGRDGDRILSSWTVRGKGLPCATVDGTRNAFDQPPHSIRPGYEAALEDPDMIERSSIAIERTNGPILMISGEADAMWPSSEYADLGMRRLSRHGFAHRYEHLRYPNAGHHIGQPNLPTRTMPGQYFAMGGDPQATAEASRDAWTQVLGFLAESLRR